MCGHYWCIPEYVYAKFYFEFAIINGGFPSKIYVCVCVNVASFATCVSFQYVDRNLLPKAECLKDTVQRVLPYWYDNIVPEIKVIFFLKLCLINL